MQYGLRLAPVLRVSEPVLSDAAWAELSGNSALPPEHRSSADSPVKEHTAASTQQNHDSDDEKQQTDENSNPNEQPTSSAPSAFARLMSAAKGSSGKRTAAVVSAPSSAKRRRCASPLQPQPALQQVHLDAGQRHVGSVVCSCCGLLYSLGQADDMRLHAKLCDAHRNGVKLCRTVLDSALHSRTATADELKVRAPLTAGGSTAQLQLLHFTAEQQLSALVVQRLNAVLRGVQQQLGSSDQQDDDSAAERKLQLSAGHSLYMVCCSQRCIAACITRDTQDTACVLRAGDTDVDTRNRVECSFGLAEMWTLSSWRRRRCMTRLLQWICRVRQTEQRRVAFSQPTRDGRLFASHWSRLAVPASAAAATTDEGSSQADVPAASAAAQLQPGDILTFK